MHYKLLAIRKNTREIEKCTKFLEMAWWVNTYNQHSNICQQFCTQQPHQALRDTYFYGRLINSFYECMYVCITS